MLSDLASRNYCDDSGIPPLDIDGEGEKIQQSEKFSRRGAEPTGGSTLRFNLHLICVICAICESLDFFPRRGAELAEVRPAFVMLSLSAFTAFR